MRAALGLLLAPSLTSFAAGEAGVAPADVQAQQFKTANEIGNSYKSMYAPGSPAIGASPADAQSQTKLADAMGKFYRDQYAPAGAPAYGAGTGGASQAEVQAQQAKTAAEMGKHWRSQFVPPALEDQVEAQQKAIEEAQVAATAAAAKAEVEKVKAEKTPQVLLGEGAATFDDEPTPAPVPQSAKDCKTMDELKAWLKARKDNLDKYVPKDYRHFADDSLKKEYDDNAKRIEAGPPDEETDREPKLPSGLGPLALSLDVDKSEDKAPGIFGDVFDRFKHEVTGVDERVKQKTDDTADKVDRAADAFKQGVNKAAMSASGKADEVQKKADEIMKQIKEEQKAEQAKTPSMLLSEDIKDAPAGRLSLAKLTLFIPACICGSLAFVTLRRRWARQSTEEAMSDYFMAL